MTRQRRKKNGCVPLLPTGKMSVLKESSEQGKEAFFLLEQMGRQQGTGVDFSGLLPIFSRDVFCGQ